MNLMSKLFKQLVKPSLTQEQWFQLICKSYLTPPVFFNDRKLPGFPNDQLQINTTGQAGIPTLREAFTFYQDCIESFESLGSPIKNKSLLLDFGAGWGRISRFFYESFLLKTSMV